MSGVAGALLVAGLLLLWAMVFAFWSFAVERVLAARAHSSRATANVHEPGLLAGMARGLTTLSRVDRRRDAEGGSRLLASLATALALGATLTALAVLPMGPPPLVPAWAELGLLVVFVALALAALSTQLTGAGRASKGSWAGGHRAATQALLGFVPLGGSLLAASIAAGTSDMGEVVLAQDGAIWRWLVVRNPFMPLAFLVMLVSGLVALGRAPFDSLTAPLIGGGLAAGGGGVKHAVLLLSRRVLAYVLCAVVTVTFLGGWLTPIAAWNEWLHEALRQGDWLYRRIALTTGFLVMLLKTLCLWVLLITLRWTHLRPRPDQATAFTVRMLLPAAAISLLGTLVWECVFP